jgi:ribosomal-protein-alanine N-acetyltransferase
MNEPLTDSASLRPVTEDDLAVLTEIEKSIQVAPWTADQFRSEMAKPYSHVWVLTDDETDTQIYGYLVFWMMMEDCHILNVGVDLPYRGMGHAKRLIRQALNLAAREGKERAILEVRKSNGSAVQLYQNLNFRIDQVRKNFYSNGEDAYQMTLSIKDDGVIHI